jgi:uncharacterized protein YjbI with pentapeptide repeats
MSDPSALADVRSHLRADCSRCAGLCCVAPALAASADFAIDKPAGIPCPNLRDDFRCGIHATLRPRGFPGCEVFDCFGAGQQLTQVTFGGRSWREEPELAATQFVVFPVMRQLQELLWYLAEALTLAAAAELHEEVRQLQQRTEQLTRDRPEDLVAFDIAGYVREAGDVLGRVSELVRSGLGGPDRRGADLIGKNLRNARLHGASLRGAYLIVADLRDAELRSADLLGADLRAADVRGADLGECLFLTQPQVEAARGDATTGIPAVLIRPAHWGA